jgi:hypothetical protein
MAPSPDPAPAPTSGVNLSYPQAIPVIPPSETSGVIPPGMQQVSVEEFQRLPGVIISGPNAGPATSPQGATVLATPQPLEPPIAAKPVGSPVRSSNPGNARQVQQTGWAPVHK